MQMEIHNQIKKSNPMFSWQEEVYVLLVRCFAFSAIFSLCSTLIFESGIRSHSILVGTATIVALGGVWLSRRFENSQFEFSIARVPGKGLRLMLNNTPSLHVESDREEAAKQVSGSTQSPSSAPKPFEHPTIIKPKTLPIPNWIQAAGAAIGILGIPVLLLLNRDFRGWLWELRLQPHRMQPQYRELIVLHVIQVLVICVVIVTHSVQFRGLRAELRNAGRIARETLQQFQDSWMFMWFAWLALYIWLSIRTFGPPSDRLDSVTDVFNVISSFSIWRCFLVLDKPSVNIDDQNPDRDKPYKTALWIAGAAGIICACLGPADRLLHLGHIGLISLGLYGGLALACLTGQFASRYIGMHTWMLLFLYLYSMIQLLYSFFDVLDARWMWAVFGSVLILKVMVGFAGLNMLKYGGLNTYLKAADAEFEIPVAA